MALLGATVSIGQSALDVIRRDREKFAVSSLAVDSRWEPLVALSEEFEPAVISVSNDESRKELTEALPSSMARRVTEGREGLSEAACAPGTDLCLAACSGFVGLEPTIAAIERGIDIALANKEVLVAGGSLVSKICSAKGVQLIPVDSEHSAIFQCIGKEEKSVQSIILTASGGPFRSAGVERLKKVTVEDALKHPSWSMGKKISIDSASMMNKGLEVIEAHFLFHIPYDDIRVIVHPQSVVHSLVEFVDSSVLAQMSPPDMRLPIHYALYHPKRTKAPYLKKLDLASIASLHFEAPNWKRFPCLKLAYDAGRMGGSMPAVLNASNEVAVAAFLRRRIAFLDIPRLIEECLAAHDSFPIDDLGNIKEADSWAREQCRKRIVEQSWN